MEAYYDPQTGNDSYRDVTTAADLVAVLQRVQQGTSLEIATNYGSWSIDHIEVCAGRLYFIIYDD